MNTLVGIIRCGIIGTFFDFVSAVSSSFRLLHQTREELKEEKALRMKQTSAMTVLWDEVTRLKEDSLARDQLEQEQQCTVVQVGSGAPKGRGGRIALNTN
jgi:hypothetical protein